MNSESLASGSGQFGIEARAYDPSALTILDYSASDAIAKPAGRTEYPSRLLSIV